MNIQYSNHGQAIAPKSIQLSKDVFLPQDNTRIYWLGNASILICSHGTNVLIDPWLTHFSLPLLVDIPLKIEDIPSIDGICITHIDFDHLSFETCSALKTSCEMFHAPNYVADVLKEKEYPVTKHDIHESFEIGSLKFTLTPTKHNWQSEKKEYDYRIWKESDYCGYWIESMDGNIWLPSDSRLLEEHLHMPHPDLILFDFADEKWHITLNGAITLANTYPHSDLLCIHYGCIDAYDKKPINGNPNDVYQKISHPERLKVVAPGECYLLEKK